VPDHGRGLDILAQLCKQGVRGSSPPLVHQANDPGQSLESSVDHRRSAPAPPLADSGLRLVSSLGAERPNLGRLVPSVAPKRSKNLARQCVFCGSADLTREHVLPDWLTEIGLDPEPSIHHVGPLNRRPREWSARPFATTVKMVCASCNNGWLSQLEGAAKPVIAPLIRGEGRRLPFEDQALIAAWTCKTALVSLLVSSEQARASGYGVPPTEYTALYAQRDRVELCRPKTRSRA